MTLVVSISEFRQHIAEYIAKVQAGHKVILRDEKKDSTIAQVTQAQEFDKDMYEKVLNKSAGVLTAEAHPEWATKEKVVKWVVQNRLKSERSF